MSTDSNSLEKLEWKVREACGELGRRLRNGEHCSAEEYFERLPAVDCHSDSVLELIYTEYVVREELGQAVTADEWYVRFPSWSDDLRQMFEVHRQFNAVETHVSVSGSSNGTPFSSPKVQSVESRHWESGRLIGCYQLFEEIGRGGMGVVYRARQLKLNRDVALKMILSGEFASPRELARFQTEAESAARLQHPNIVQVFEVSAYDRHPYLSMELVDGGNLEAQLKVHRMAPHDAARLLETIARAVHFAHQSGVIHRDLKPSNVLLTSTGEPKVADFGLAKQLLEGQAENTQSGAIVGTPSYLAPELVGRGKASIGPTSDVYSLGVMLFEMMTGRLPFVAESPLELLKCIVSEDPSLPSDFCPNLPKDLETICLKCLNKEPYRRYGAAAELADDLHRFLIGEPIRARRIGIAERAAKWTRRRPLAASFILFLVASLTAVSMLLWTANERGKQAEMAAQKANRLREAAELAHQRSERSLYFHRIGQANAEWHANMVNRASTLLDECPPDMRHFEWQYLKSLCNSDLLTIQGHADPVRCLEVSPDGKTIASATGLWGVNQPGEIKLWDAHTGKQIAIIHGHSGPVMSLAFSPDSQTLASASVGFGIYKPANVKIWNLQGQLLVSLPPPLDHAYVLAFNLGGNLLAIGGFESVYIWNLATGKLHRKLTGHTGPILDIAFDPTGTSLATASRDGSSRVFELETGKETQVFSGFGDLRNVAYSPDGSTLVFTNYGGDLRLWNVSKPPQELEKFSYSVRPITGIAFSPEGRRIGLSSQDGTAIIVDIRTGKELKHIRAHDGNVFDLEFAENGRRIITSGVDGLVRVWDARTDWEPSRVNTKLLFPKTQILAFPHFAITPNRKYVLLPSGLRNSNPGQGEKGLLVINLENVSANKILYGHKGFLTDVAVTPDGNHYLTSSEDCTARIWNATSGVEEFQLPHPEPVTSICCNSNGSIAATGCSNGKARLWRIETGEVLQEWQAHDGRITRVAYSPVDEQLATVGQDGMVRLWNTVLHRERVVLKGHNGPVKSVVFSHSGKWLATCGDDKCIKIWSENSGELVHTLKGHIRAITELTFSPDDKRLASCSLDGTIKLWDIDSGEEAITLRDKSGVVDSVQFHPDGHRILSTSSGNLCFWDARPMESPMLETKFQAANTAWHSQRAKTLRTAGQVFASNFHYEKLADIGAETIAEYGLRAVARSQTKQWKLALEDFRVLMESNPENRETIANYGMCQLEAGNTDEYRIICHRLMDSINEKTKPFQINNAVWLSVLNCSNSFDFDEMVAVLQGAHARADETQKKGMNNTLGAALYRASRYEEARVSLHRSLEESNPSYVEDWILLSMVEAKLNNTSQSHIWLDKYKAWKSGAADTGVGQLAASLAWDTRSAQEILAKEASKLLIDTTATR